jgi:hypothetical protein
MASYDILVSNSNRVEIRYKTYRSVDSTQEPPISYDAVETFKKILTKEKDSCILSGSKEWILDLDKLKENFTELSSLDWFKGRILLEPQAKVYEDIQSKQHRRRHIDLATQGGKTGIDHELFIEHSMPIQYTMMVYFIITPEKLKNTVLIFKTPVEIQHSIKNFQLDYPDHLKTAFIIMQFRETTAHQKIFEAIKNTLSSNGIIGLRADDKQYHDDLLQNVITYMHGCSFGIAVFERIEGEEFNPNISLEVGYLMAMMKPICLLKDKSLKTLHTDIIGRVYQVFDPYDPFATISRELSSWLSQKGFK